MDGSMFADYSKGVSYFFWQIMVYMYMCVQNLLHKNSYIRPPSDAFVYICILLIPMTSVNVHVPQWLNSDL